MPAFAGKTYAAIVALAAAMAGLALLLFFQTNS